MYRDNTLIPAEAIRLAALGELCGGEKTYGVLASGIRHVVARLVGPSLDLLGSSLEVLHLEGLIEPVGTDEVGENTELKITDAGRELFARLMASAVRAPMNDVSRLVIALKLKYLTHLDPVDRDAQVDMMIELFEADRNRMEDLRRSEDAGLLAKWLDLDIAQAETRLSWLKGLKQA